MAEPKNQTGKITRDYGEWAVENRPIARPDGDEWFTVMQGGGITSGETARKWIVENAVKECEYRIIVIKATFRIEIKQNPVTHLIEEGVANDGA